LATIAGYSEVYLSGAATDSDSVEKQMTRINGEAARLGRLVESMLTITRLDNEVALETEAVNLVEIASAAVADAAFGSSKPEAATQFSLCGADDGPLLVEGDRDSLYRALANLLANVQVHAPGAEAVVSIEVEGVDAVITVSDDGPGMPPHVAANAFDRFFRGSPTSDSGLRTSGLGLSITAGIVKAHGGTIELDTAQGEGATFTIRLPLADSELCEGSVMRR
jgi:two-component system OmpR family sensor kinase